MMIETAVSQMFIELRLIPVRDPGTGRIALIVIGTDLRMHDEMIPV